MNFPTDLLSNLILTKVQNHPPPADYMTRRTKRQTLSSRTIQLVFPVSFLFDPPVGRTGLASPTVAAAAASFGAAQFPAFEGD